VFHQLLSLVRDGLSQLSAGRIQSERKLMEMVNLNLAHRWYLGYDLDKPLPDHSSLSKIIDRFGLGVFQSFFEEVVQLSADAGLV